MSLAKRFFLQFITKREREREFSNYHAFSMEIKRVYLMFCPHKYTLQKYLFSYGRPFNLIITTYKTLPFVTIRSYFSLP